MPVYIGENKLVIITESKTFYFGFPKNLDNLMHLIDFIIKQNELLAGYTIKTEIGQLFSKYEHGNDIHEHRKR